MPTSRKKKVRKAPKKSSNFWEQYKRYIIPSAIAGVIAWFFGRSLELGIVVFIAVWIGNWIGVIVLKKK